MCKSSSIVMFINYNIKKEKVLLLWTGQEEYGSSYICLLKDILYPRGTPIWSDGMRRPSGYDFQSSEISKSLSGYTF